MLTITPKHIKAFKQDALNNFEDKTYLYLKQFFPKNCEIHGEIKMREIIRYGIKQAELFGFMTEQDVTMFINLTLMLGHHFYKDPQISWASNIFNAETISSSIKIERIYNEAIIYLDSVSGKNDENIKLALHRIQKKTATEIFQPYTSTFEQGVLDYLKEIFPEKYDAIGESNMKVLFQKGSESAQVYNIKNQEDCFIYICCMFILGCGFDTDPQFSWATDVLKEYQGEEQNVETGNKLYIASIASLMQWLV